MVLIVILGQSDVWRSSIIIQTHVLMRHSPTAIWAKCHNFTLGQTNAHTSMKFSSYHLMQQNIPIFGELDVSCTGHKPVKGTQQLV